MLVPSRVARAVEMVKRKQEEARRNDSPADRRGTLRSEIAGLEREIGRLVDALAKGTAYDAISAALSDREARLQRVRAELEALDSPASDPSALYSGLRRTSGPGSTFCGTSYSNSTRTRFVMPWVGSSPGSR